MNLICIVSQPMWGDRRLRYFLPGNTGDIANFSNPLLESVSYDPRSTAGSHPKLARVVFFVCTMGGLTVAADIVLQVDPGGLRACKVAALASPSSWPSLAMCLGRCSRCHCATRQPRRRPLWASCGRCSLKATVRRWAALMRARPTIGHSEALGLLGSPSPLPSPVAASLPLWTTSRHWCRRCTTTCWPRAQH